MLSPITYVTLLIERLGVLLDACLAFLNLIMLLLTFWILWDLVDRLGIVTYLFDNAENEI